MEKGTDVNAQEGRYGNTLQSPSSNLHQEIAKLLMKNGADVNAQGGFYINVFLVVVHNAYLSYTDPLAAQNLVENQSEI